MKMSRMDEIVVLKICNGVVNVNLIDDLDEEETDETNCDEWKHICALRNSDCESPFEYKATADSLPHKIDMKYHIPYCRTNYPTDYRKIYRCTNICVTIDQLCDGRRDCLSNEDEQICPSRVNSSCPEGRFYCKGRGPVSSKCLINDVKCNGVWECSGYDHEDRDELYCNLIPQFRPYDSFSFNQHSQYPPIGIIHYEMNYIQEQPFHVRHQFHTRRSLIDNLTITYACNHGILVHGVNDSYTCFCSPAYFGDKCQYQQERLTVHLRLETTIIDDADTYKILIRLQTSTNMFYDYIDFTFINYDQTPYKTVVYLLTPGLHQQYSVNIDIFQITKNNVSHHSSYHYPVSFTFLPVNRLAKRIIIENQMRSILCSIECSLNSHCMSYANNANKHFCLCDPGWTGDLCDQKVILVLIVT
ncbi:unnamed protein product [Didymodactylos carnosus]|uniref:EGF-like domain-containing protein n=1 Tax=Didymodactylos carnosus TaxID=1234261 RepID=A0A815UFD5_9BILA|nr:unnamed protein product [Didymodactylos carnosus]CAF4379477.1 unnamed protein product [Didymodactylos carnosus]